MSQFPTQPFTVTSGNEKGDRYFFAKGCEPLNLNIQLLIFPAALTGSTKRLRNKNKANIQSSLYVSDLCQLLAAA